MISPISICHFQILRKYWRKNCELYCQIFYFYLENLLFLNFVRQLASRHYLSFYSNSRLLSPRNQGSNEKRCLRAFLYVKRCFQHFSHQPWLYFEDAALLVLCSTNGKIVLHKTTIYELMCKFEQFHFYITSV